MQAGFDKLPTLAGNGSKLVQINSGGTAMAAIALTVGAILFGGAAGVLGQDGTNFFWDNTAKRLGIGNAAPTVALDVTGAIKTSTTLTASTSVVTPLVFSSTASLLFGTTAGNILQLANPNLQPTADLGLNFGSPSNRIANVFTPAIDSGTTGSLSLKTNNGTTQAEISHTGGTIVNWFQLTGNITTGAPQLRASGSDTDIDAIITSKGAGSIDFRTNNSAVVGFRVLHTASATRFITVTGSNGGNPTISTTAGFLAITPAVVAAANVAAPSISAGTNPATSGALRVPFGDGVVSRNSANSLNAIVLSLLTRNGVNNVVSLGFDANTVGVEIGARSGSGAPTVADLVAGSWTLWRDTTGLTTKLYYNNGGVIQSVALA